MISPKPTLKNEPPGPRRCYLALRRKGLSQVDIARKANCDRSWVSKVVKGGFKETDLVKRIKKTLVESTGQRPSWLFAHHIHGSTLRGGSP